MTFSKLASAAFVCCRRNSSSPGCCCKLGVSLHSHKKASDQGADGGTYGIAELLERHQDLDRLLRKARVVDLVELFVAAEVGEALAELAGLLLGKEADDLGRLERIADRGLDGLG